MKNRERQKANRKKYKALEREASRLAGLDNFIGNRERYRDPTADAAIAAVCRAQAKKPAIAARPTSERHGDSIV